MTRYEGWADPDRPQRASDADGGNVTLWLRAMDEGIKVEVVEDVHADPRAEVCPVCGCGPLDASNPHADPLIADGLEGLTGRVRGWPAHPSCERLAETLPPRPAFAAPARSWPRPTLYGLIVLVVLVTVILNGHGGAVAVLLSAAAGLHLTELAPLWRRPPPPTRRETLQRTTVPLVYPGGRTVPADTVLSPPPRVVMQKPPHDRDRRPIESLECGESGWTVPWALERTPDGTLWLCTGFTVHDHPGGTVQLHVKRDVGGLWAVEGPLADAHDTTTTRRNAERVVSATDTRREDTR